jgi:hypothetical protein
MGLKIKAVVEELWQKTEPELFHQMSDQGKFHWSVAGLCITCAWLW